MVMQRFSKIHHRGFSYIILVVAIVTTEFWRYYDNLNHHDLDTESFPVGRSWGCHALSTSSGGMGFGLTNNQSFDRFRAECPVTDLRVISRFDASLVDQTTLGDSSTTEKKDNENDEDTAWVAVFRSRSNGPAVLARDSFFQSMDLSVSNAALGGKDSDSSSNSSGSGVGFGTTSIAYSSKRDSSSMESQAIENSKVMIQAPVAVARLRKSELNDKQWVLDSMRCSLKKEHTNPDCDGGSEHTEALSVCIDELMVHHLTRTVNESSSNNNNSKNVSDGTDDSNSASSSLSSEQTNVLPSTPHFEQSIRCKATLVSAPLLEARGFKEVEELTRDMATHISSLDGALEKYAERASAVDGVVWKSPQIRDRTLQIVSLLGRLDQTDEKENIKLIHDESGDNSDDDDDDKPDIDPWANVKQFLL